MVRIDVVLLPGLGALRAFRTEASDKIAVLALPSGRRQLFVEDPADPDNRQLVADLTEDDAQVLAELLGGPLLQMQVAEQQNAAALLDWVRIPPGSRADGAAIRDFRLREVAGATVVAVIRDDELVADPEPECSVRANDVVIITGGADDLAEGRRVLTSPKGD